MQYGQNAYFMYIKLGILILSENGTICRIPKNCYVVTVISQIISKLIYFFILCLYLHTKPNAFKGINYYFSM